MGGVMVEETRLSRPSSPQADAILGEVVPVLDHGHVRLIDYMGNDAAIVQAARVSYGAGTKKRSEDHALVRFLLRHAHTSPFEMVETKFHVKAPIFVARQWGRHRVAAINEVSSRYSILPAEMYLPPDTQISFQATDNRQGRSAVEVPPEVRERVRNLLLAGQEQAYGDYDTLIDLEIARELARISLPVSIYTEWYWKISLHNLFHFLELRLDEHAQWEIRQYAEVLADMARLIAPVACAAFEEFRAGHLRLSWAEMAVVRRALAEAPPTPQEWEALGKRERKEFAARFGLTAPGEERGHARAR